MGEWKKRPRSTAQLHKHDMPLNLPNKEDVLVGDGWLCSCGDTFRVTGVKRGYDLETGLQRLFWALDLQS